MKKFSRFLTVASLMVGFISSISTLQAQTTDYHVPMYSHSASSFINSGKYFIVGDTTSDAWIKNTSTGILDFGDINQNHNGYGIILNDNGKDAQIGSLNQAAEADFNGEFISSIGDVQNNNNGTEIVVDDNTQSVSILNNTHNVLDIFTIKNTGIGTSTPNSSAILDVEGTLGGFLEPQLTSTQRTAITSPASGLQVYDKTLNIPYYYNGTAWLPIDGTAWSFAGNAGTSPATNFLGTTDTATLVFKVNNNQSGWIDEGKYANTGIGYLTLHKITSGYYNTSLGYKALYSNESGTQNTAIGYEALYSAAANANAQGSENTATGYLTLYANTIGTQNTANGTVSLELNTTGNDNTATGFEALAQNTTGSNNTTNGVEALFKNITGSSNTVLGCNAGYNSTGSWNTFLGDSSGYLNTTGTYNTYLGYKSGNLNANITVSNCTFLGYAAGESSLAPTANTVYIGNTSIGTIYGEVALSTYSDGRIKDNIQENVPGLAFINKLKPVSYNLNIHKQNQLMGITDAQDWNGKYAIEKITQSGFIAQDVEAAAQSCGYDFSGVDKPTTPDGLYALRYSEFVVPLVKAVQELNAKNDTLHSTIGSLHASVDSLRNAFKNIQACLNKLCIESTSNNSGNISDNNTTNVQDVTLSSTNAPLLYQNNPNPFGSGGAKINYYLPEGAQGAIIVFYDSYGNELKQVQLSQIGNGSLNVTPDNLNNGIYSYSLIVNGTVIDTKRMVLQK